MRILHTNFLHGWGGQSNRILEEARGVAARGHFVALSAPPDAELLKRGEADGLTVYRQISYRGGFRPAMISDVLAMRRLLMEGRFDILHLHGGRDSLIAALALPLVPRQQRPRVIRTKHNVFPIGNHFGNRHLYGRVFEMNVALSGAIVDQLRDTGWVRPDTIRRIPSAIDPARFEAAPGTRERMRAEFGFGPEDCVVAMVGRFRPEKAYDVLMPAAAIAVRQVPHLKFLLLGAGSQLDAMQTLVSENGLGGVVQMPGFRKDIPDCLSAADLYTQPSRSEGLGTGVLEAAAARLPIVASRVGGIPDIIATPEMGILVPSEDPAALAAGIVKLATQPERARAMGQAVRAHVEGEFSIPTLVERTERAYQELLAMPRSR
jgi:glycosyltransferase involved in cell wall biosynthesis